MSPKIARLVVAFVLLIHALSVFITIVGGALVALGILTRYPFWFAFYLVVIALVILLYVATKTCVLTTLEHYLRRTYLPGTDCEGGFFAHYMEMLHLHVSDTTTFGLIVSFLGIGIIGSIWRVWIK